MARHKYTIFGKETREKLVPDNYWKPKGNTSMKKNNKKELEICYMIKFSIEYILIMLLCSFFIPIPIGIIFIGLLNYLLGYHKGLTYYDK